jgi:hypothetical protein
VSTDEWNTPKWLADALGDFDMDPCSNDASHISSTNRHTEKTNGLEWEWTGSVFVNPPYSNPLPWCQRLAEHKAPWCALLKLDPTTKWWAALMQANPTIAPFRRRLKFEGEQSMTANFPSVLVWNRWKPSRDLAAHLWMQEWR